MHDFPLAPFLTALGADGFHVTLHDYERLHLALYGSGPWTLKRLQDVLLSLLVRDEEQETIFLRRFDSFFDPGLDTPFSELDLQRALDDLRTLGQQAAPHSQQRSPKIRLREFSPPQHTQLSPWHFVWKLAVPVVVVGLALFIGVKCFSPLPNDDPVTQGKPGTEDAEGDETQPTTEYPRPAFCDTDEPLQLTAPPNPALQRAALGAGSCLFLLILYGLYLRHARKIPEEETLVWDHGSGLRHFRMGTIGGQPAPRLTAATLDHLADSLGYFQSEQISTRLNVPASIDATGHNGGIPTLEYHKRKQVRSVLILEDAFAEARAWNPIAEELREGLGLRGIPVLSGQFFGSLTEFCTAEGTVFRLEDLEDDRRGYLVLVFSDSKGLQYHRDPFALEPLLSWPMLAWMELREPSFWDESTAMVARRGLPIYPATPDGLLQALGRFMTERGAGAQRAPDTTAWHGIPTYQGTTSDSLAAYLEYILGDALPWAQACAMLQPISLGVADVLRREFCSDLPAERIERLFVLPHTLASVSGLQFSDQVLAVLRHGFTNRWTEENQERVLRFLLDKLNTAKPQQEKGSPSLASLSWEWTREQVRLLLEPEIALKRLSELAQETSPLQAAVQTHMEGCVLAGQSGYETAPTPLWRPVNDRHALQRLARLAPKSGAKKRDVYPVAWGHRLGLGVLGLSFLACLGWGITSATNPPAALQLPPTFVNDIGMEFVLIPEGSFQMGSPDDEPGRDNDEQVHHVKISKPFYLGKYEVTQEEWIKIMGKDKNPSSFTGDHKLPVENLSWEDVQKFILKLNEKEGGTKYRLPTEAEWEYAARAGTSTAYSFGDNAEQLEKYGWYSKNSEKKTHPVGQLEPNPWGLYDMHGNVWEWVYDWYGSYSEESVVNPCGPPSGSYRVVRGCSWGDGAQGCRSANRSYATPGSRGNFLGFRLLRTAP